MCLNELFHFRVLRGTWLSFWARNILSLTANLVKTGPDSFSIRCKILPWKLGHHTILSCIFVLSFSQLLAVLHDYPILHKWHSLVWRLSSICMNNWRKLPWIFKWQFFGESMMSTTRSWEKDSITHGEYLKVVSNFCSESGKRTQRTNASRYIFWAL